MTDTKPFCDFCSSPLTFREVDFLGRDIGVFLLIIASLYLATCLVLLAVIYFQEYAAKRGNDNLAHQAVKTVIFPVFVQILWFNTFINVYVGVAYFAFPYNLESHESMGSVVAFSLVWALQHFLIEGVALLLMQKGLGHHAANRVVFYAGIWGCITFVVEMIINLNFNLFSLSIDVIWSAALLFFYLALWITPQKHLFRRPATIMYAKFWFIFRFFTLLARILTGVNDVFTKSLGSCVYVFFSLLVFAAVEPLVLYYTLLQDCMWWQGMVINQGRRNISVEDIRGPLEGVDLNLKSAQSLAYSMDQMRSGSGGGGVGVVSRQTDIQHPLITCVSVFISLTYISTSLPSPFFPSRFFPSLLPSPPPRLSCSLGSFTQFRYDNIRPIQTAWLWVIFQGNLTRLVKHCSVSVYPLCLYLHQLLFCLYVCFYICLWYLFGLIKQLCHRRFVSGLQGHLQTSALCH